MGLLPRCLHPTTISTSIAPSASALTTWICACDQNPLRHIQRQVSVAGSTVQREHTGLTEPDRRKTSDGLMGAVGTVPSLHSFPHGLHPHSPVLSIAKGRKVRCEHQGWHVRLGWRR
jgi:hypothetical protein